MGLTLSRLVITPVVLLIYVVFLLPVLQADGGWPVGGEPVVALSIVLFLTLSIEATDILDGHFARRWKQVSDAGKFLDPLADSVSHSTVFLCFVAAGYAPVWMVALIFFRESLVSGLRIASASQNVIIAARPSGKLKAILQGIVINVVVGFDLFRAAGIYPRWAPGHADLAWWCMLAVTALTVLSAFDYFRGNRAVVRRIFSGVGPPDTQIRPTEPASSAGRDRQPSAQ